MVWQECNEVSWHALGNDVDVLLLKERGATNRWDTKLDLKWDLSHSQTCEN